MSRTYSPKRFTNIGLLRKLDFPLLIRLLESHKDFFEAQPGFFFTNIQDEFPYPVLCQIMLDLGTAAPIGLLESLYYIEQIATTEHFDELLSIARDNGVAVPPNATPEDVTILLWFKCREEVELFHAQMHRNDAQKRAKRFESYFVTNGIMPLQNPTQELLENMEADLNDWAEKNRRGLGMRVFVVNEGDAVWFMIRHGQPMKRQNTVEEDGRDGWAFFRPEKFDVAIYYPATGELAMSAKTKGEQNAYARAIGTHCFGDAEYFNMIGCFKYTLQPLIDDGPDSLACLVGDTAIEGARLCELHLYGEHPNCPVEIRRGEDIFAAFEEKGRHLAVDDAITAVKAKFKIQFSDKRERSVTIQIPNIAIYDHETDHDVLHPWLVNKGFIVNEFLKVSNAK